MKMNPPKKIIGNLFWVVLLVAFLFTPVGFHVKVFFARLFSSSPSELKGVEQTVLVNNDWKLEGLEGEPVDFNVFNGKVVVLNFWATWCPPCIAEMPSFEKLYHDYADQVAFVFVANDDAQKVLRFVRENKTPLPIYFEKSATPAQLASKSIPASYIIDTNGTIILKKIGVADWNGERTRILLDRLLED